MRDAHLAISGVVFFVIDPPRSAAGYAFKSPGELWIADGSETRSIPECTKAIGKKLLHSVPGEAFVQSFFHPGLEFARAGVCDGLRDETGGRSAAL